MATQQAPLPNLNTVTFPAVTAQRVRISVTHTAGFGTGVREVQVFDAVGCDRTITGTRIGRLTVESGVTCLAEGALVIGPVRLTGTATGVTPIDVVHNTIAGPLQCTGNSPSPVDNGLPNTVLGPVTGQCADF